MFVFKNFKFWKILYESHDALKVNKHTLPNVNTRDWLAVLKDDVADIRAVRKTDVFQYPVGTVYR